MSSSVYYFKAISEFKLELQSGNAQFWSKSANFWPHVNLKFGRMPLKNNRAPLRSYFKLCVSFHNHWSTWSYSPETPNSYQNLRFFLSRATLKFDGWPWKTIGHLFYTTLSFVPQFIAIGEFKLELQSGNAQLGSKSASFCPVWPWNLMDDLEKQ